MAFLTLLITAAGFAQFNPQGRPIGFCGEAASQGDKSFLAIIAPMLEPNSWPIYTLSYGEPLDANRMSAANNSADGADKNKITALAMHALCADVLTTYVNEKGLVDYKTLKRKRLSLLNVLNEFGNLDPNSYAAWSKADKLAFWINAHNMCILKAVIENYPIQPSRFKVIFYPPNSVMQLSDFWAKADHTIMGEKYSLEEIENKIIRTQFNEPRVCFALSYASLGCAPLRREPYYGKSLGEQLDDQARIFIESEMGMQIDRDSREVSLSAIFQWYGKEFITKYPPAKSFEDKNPAEAAVLTYICQHAPKKDSDWLLRKIFTVKYIRYDWSLNEQP